MTLPFKIETLSGAVDGTNRVFSTSLNYFPGSIVASIRGILRLGVVELDEKRIQLAEAPEPGDVVQGAYRPR